MKVVVLSDLNWDPHLRTISDYELQNFSLRLLSLPRYERIKRYLDIIENESPDLVLFAGDVTGDGSCGHGFHYAFIILLSILENKKLQSFYISGNHDEPGYYDLVNELTQNYKFTQDISEQDVQFKGLKILGLSYNCSKSKRSLRAEISKRTDTYDIIVAHAQLKRRIRLFDIRSQYIFTGHYDRKLCAHRDTVFVSLDNDSEEVSYAVLNKTDSGDQVSISVQKDRTTHFSYTENRKLLLKSLRNNILKINGTSNIDLELLERYPTQNLVDDTINLAYLKFIRGTNYSRVLNGLYKHKQQLPLDKLDLPIEKVAGLPITPMYNISKSLIQDYLK